MCLIAEGRVELLRETSRRVSLDERKVQESKKHRSSNDVWDVVPRYDIINLYRYKFMVKSDYG